MKSLRRNAPHWMIANPGDAARSALELMAVTRAASEFSATQEQPDPRVARGVASLTRLSSLLVQIGCDERDRWDDEGD